MIAVAVLLMLAAEPQAPTDCASAAPRGPDFMAMVVGGAKARPGKTLHDHLGGTITDPPAPRESMMPGATSMTGAFAPQADRPQADTREDAEQQARNEAAGICNAGKHPA